MNQYNYLIIGGGIAGTSAAETIRKNDPVGSIAIVSDEQYPLYSRIMLSKPNWFLEKIPYDKVWLKSDVWYQENKIELLRGKKAVSIDSSAKNIVLESGEKIVYEKLLIATGVCARPWNIPGSDKKGIYNLRTLEDGKGIMKSAKTAKKALAIGGGFISFEMADLLNELGLEVTVIIRQPYYWEPILDEMAGKMVEEAIEKSGIKILRNTEVVEVTGNEVVEGVSLNDGTKLDCRLIVTGIGVVCQSKWLSESGIQVNRGVLANQYLQTNQPDIWVAGDVSEYDDLILGETVQLGNWVNAQKQGQVAGQNMVGKQEPYKFVSFYTAHGFDMDIAFIGNVRPGDDRDMIVRSKKESGFYSRLIVKDKELVGAFLINGNKELAVLQKLIENNCDVSGQYDQIVDPAFDLKLLLKNQNL